MKKLLLSIVLLCNSFNFISMASEAPAPLQQLVVAGLPVHIAAKTGDIQELKNHIKDFNEFNAEGDRPIHCAAKNLQLSVIGLLVDHVSIDSTNIYGMTALHTIASLGNGTQLLYLLNRDASLNIQDRNSLANALHYAVFNQNLQTTKMILEYSKKNSQKAININAQDKFGQSALHMAVVNMNFPIARELVNAGIDTSLAIYSNNKTALDCALDLREAGYDMNAIMNIIDPKFLANEAIQIEQAQQVYYAQQQMLYQQQQGQAMQMQQAQQYYAQQQMQQQAAMQMHYQSQQQALQQQQQLPRNVSNVRPKKQIKSPKSIIPKTNNNAQQQAESAPILQMPCEVSQIIEEMICKIEAESSSSIEQKSPEMVEPKQDVNKVEDVQEQIDVMQKDISVRPVPLSEEEFPSLSAALVKKPEVVKTNQPKAKKVKQPKQKIEQVIVAEIVDETPVQAEPVKQLLADVEVVSSSDNSNLQSQATQQESVVQPEEESTVEDVENFAKQEFKRDKISKYQLEKKKKEEAKAKALLAKHKKKSGNKQVKVSNVVQEESQEQVSPANSVSSVNSFEMVNEDVVEQERQEESPVQVEIDLSLHKAITSNKPLEEIKKLITFESVITADKDGNYPLHLAAVFKNLDACQYIVDVLAENIEDPVELRKSIDALNTAERTALYYAIDKKHLAIIDYLLSKDADRDALPEKIKNRLVALAEQHAKGLATSVESNTAKTESNEYVPNLDAINADFKRAEQEAFGFGLAALSDEQKDVTKINKREYAKFIKAIRDGKLNTVKQLVYKDPNFIYFADSDGEMALHCAVVSDCKKGDKEFKITKFLVAGDPRYTYLKDGTQAKNHNCIFAGDLRIVYADNNRKITPFHLAVSNGNVEMCKYFTDNILRIPDLDFTDLFMKLKVFAMRELVKSPKNKNIQQVMGSLDVALKYLMERNKPKQQEELVVPEIENFAPRPNPYLDQDQNTLTNLLCMNVQTYTQSKNPSILQDIVELISAGAELRMRDGRGATYLHIFAELGNHVMVKHLLANGADAQARDVQGNTPLHWTARWGYTLVARELLNKNPESKNEINKLGDTPIHVAACCGHTKFIELLIEFEADTQIKNEELLTPLLVSAVTGQQSAFHLLAGHAENKLKISWIKLLADCDDADKKTNHKYSKLSYYKEYVLVYLDKQKDSMFLRDNSQGQQQIDSGIAEKPNPYLNFNKDKLNQILFEAVKIYVKSKFPPIRESIIKMIEADADLNIKNDNDITYLHYFAGLGDHEVVKLLLDHDADPEARDNLGNMPLHYAACGGFTKVVSLLVAIRPGTKNAINNQGSTPLHKGVKHIEVVKLLIKLGVNTQLKDGNLFTPLMVAMIQKYPSCEILLISAPISIHDAARTGDIKGIKDNIIFKDELDLLGE